MPDLPHAARGVSVREVDAAAERRVLEDQNRDAANGDDNAYLTITRAGQRFNVMFFPTEDHTNPMLSIGSRLPPSSRGAVRWSGRVQLSDHAAIREAVAHLDRAIRGDGEDEPERQVRERATHRTGPSRPRGYRSA